MKERLERIVPPLFLCRKVPMKEEADRAFQYFNDSALVWVFSEPDMGWQVLPRDMAEHNDCPIFPAPTLEEIYEQIKGECDIPLFDGGYIEFLSEDRTDQFCCPLPAVSSASALVYWLRDMGVEVV